MDIYGHIYMTTYGHVWPYMYDVTCEACSGPAEATDASSQRKAILVQAGWLCFFGGGSDLQRSPE